MLTDDLYKIVFKDDNKVIIKLSDCNHPVFKAHFPGNPILPGFINFDIISELFNFNITKIKKAKFIKTIKPNQIITYERNGNNFKVFCEKENVISITL